MKELNRFIGIVGTVTKWGLVVTALVTAIKVFKEELEKIQPHEPVK